MIEMVFYSVLAIAVLVLAAWLVRAKPPSGADDVLPKYDYSECILTPQCLELANRIFDPADYRWLHDELCFPEAAQVLARHRKELALSWLKGLRNAFEKLLRLPDAPFSEEGQPGEFSSWRVPLLAVRFHLLLLYALVVVRLFGPYHRLVPRFGWLGALRDLGLQHSRRETAKAGR